MNNTFYYDFEVEYTTAAETKQTLIGYSPSEQEAEARLRAIYPDVQSVRVLRTIKEYASRDTPICELVDGWEDGRFILRDHQGREATSEHGGGHLRDALQFLRRVRPHVKWKTLAVACALRQAFREDTVNGHEDALKLIWEHGPARAYVESYLYGARSRDRLHHGVHTF